MKLLLIIGVVLTNVIAQLSLKKGMLLHGRVFVKFPSLLIELFEIFTNLYVILGLAAYVFSFVLYLVLLSSTELSIAYPIIMSAALLLVLFLSGSIFGESITLTKIVGVLLLSSGIILLLRAI